MIKSVTLENFQSHPKLTLEMGKLTMLTGTSNSGKSAVLRALAGMLRNDSAGAYITHGQKQLKVSVTTDDGHVVDWVKGNGANDYFLHVPGEAKPKEFIKVGAGVVPDEVKDVLRMSPIRLTDKIKLHANLHEQLESPFLVSKEYTAGDAAKIFGELTSASKLYAAVAEGNRRGKAAMGLRKTRRGDLEALATELMGYEDLDEQRSSVERARLSIESAMDCDYALSEATKLLTSISEAHHQIEVLDSKVPFLTAAANVDLDGAVEAVEQYRSLGALILNHQKASETLAMLYKLEAPLTSAAAVDLEEVEGVQATISHLENVLWSYGSAERNLEAFDAQVAAREAELAALDLSLAEAYTSLDTCPSCGQGLEGDTAKHHLLETHA